MRSLILRILGYIEYKIIYKCNESEFITIRNCAIIQQKIKYIRYLRVNIKKTIVPIKLN